MEQITRKPFYFLDGLFRVLIVDSDAARARMLVFSLPSVFVAQTVSSVERADKLMCNSARFHACILSLGEESPKDDSFVLLRKYAQKIPCILYCTQGDIRDGFDACRLGAVDLVSRQKSSHKEELVKLLCEWVLRCTINPLYCRRENGALDKATDALFMHSPTQVTGWAMALSVSDREIRHLWKKKMGANAKIILFMYHVFKELFLYYDTVEKYTTQKDVYRHCEEYYHMHRSLINAYIAFGHAGSSL